jgi:hypothetical protein
MPRISAEIKNMYGEIGSPCLQPLPNVSNFAPVLYYTTLISVPFLRHTFCIQAHMTEYEVCGQSSIIQDSLSFGKTLTHRCIEIPTFYQ